MECFAGVFYKFGDSVATRPFVGVAAQIVGCWVKILILTQNHKDLQLLHQKDIVAPLLAYVSDGLTRGMVSVPL